ncbi:TetR/AcrR family transcriptional regulator [Mycobacterium sp. 236(2023)]|uniref:TetR/AcrR family transcriptional regulator n=1 Tax=Mycobacterium sp. 236(2023) TaxID=3038163 RepID=UPI0024153F93|nr:TetR/AcrR family transcriptional regulator [Mycobacterium sp. 236(2023)]MDG4668020.1 helix-turn-helix domain containing protein [Mycobacterium sp. 236(2023)]
MPAAPQKRRRGRPPGGGHSGEQSRQHLMDAAERSFLDFGYRASTMETIAAAAGYSRASIYRQFPNRRALLDALVERATHRHLGGILDRLPPGAGVHDMLTESLVIVATELSRDPILRTVSQESEDGSVAHAVAASGGLAAVVESAVGAVMKSDDGGAFRPGLCTRDVTQFLITTCVGFLLGLNPDLVDAGAARRYVHTFVLPALLVEHPAPQKVHREKSSSPRGR